MIIKKKTSEIQTHNLLDFKVMHRTTDATGYVYTHRNTRGTQQTISTTIKR